MPGCAEAAKVIFVQLLHSLRFAMAVEPLTDLQSDKLERMRGGAGAGTMRPNDQNRRFHLTQAVYPKRASKCLSASAANAWSSGER